jgi:hypothetical protein
LRERRPERQRDAVIVDVDPETLCIDVAAAEAAIGERTRRSTVHVAGAVCDLDLSCPLQRRGLHLIEDCAHAHGCSGEAAGRQLRLVRELPRCSRAKLMSRRRRRADRQRRALLDAA